MELLQSEEQEFFEEGGHMMRPWCSCSFWGICSFNKTTGGCNWLGGACAFGSMAVCDYQSCGNIVSE